MRRLHLHIWGNLSPLTKVKLGGFSRYYEERPQGEWIDHSEDGYVECPICNCLTNCEDNIDELHYCWNCGANMKGGAE